MPFFVSVNGRFLTPQGEFVARIPVAPVALGFDSQAAAEAKATELGVSGALVREVNAPKPSQRFELR
jgi:hypothetical protein